MEIVELKNTGYNPTSERMGAIPGRTTFRRADAGAIFECMDCGFSTCDKDVMKQHQDIRPQQERWLRSATVGACPQCNCCNSSFEEEKCVTIVYRCGRARNLCLSCLSTGKLRECADESCRCTVSTIAPLLGEVFVPEETLASLYRK